MDDPDRNSNGRFKKGWKGGPGRPQGSVRKYKKIHDLLMDAATDEDEVEMVKVLVREARGGNLRAIDTYFDRKYGKPTQTITGSMGHYAVEPTDDDVEIARRICDTRAINGRASGSS